VERDRSQGDLRELWAKDPRMEEVREVKQSMCMGER
jgi:hypothetical protein